MNTRQNKLILFALLLLTQTFISAQTHSTKIELPEDSISVAAVNDSVPAKRSFFKKFLDYFNDANKEKKNKKFDFSVIGGPHYSSDTKFGLGLVAAGLYRTDSADTIMWKIHGGGLPYIIRMKLMTGISTEIIAACMTIPNIWLP